MALLAVEGWDDGLYTKRGYTDSLGSVSTTYGRDGTNGVRLGDDTTTRFMNAHASTDTTLIMGANIYIDDGYSFHPTSTFFGFFDGTPYDSHGVRVRFNHTLNYLRVDDLTGSTDGSTNTFYEDTWYYLELKVTFHNTTGSWELRVDGDTYLSATSRDTINSNTPSLYTRIGGSDAYDVDTLWCDNYYVCDSTGTSNNDFLGPVKVETLLPNGNGNSSDMLGSDSNKVDNYLLVDNNATTPPATTEYVGSGTEGEKDTYAMGNLSGTNDVLGVQTSIYAAKDDTQAKYMRPVIRSGTTDYTGTSEALAEDAYFSLDNCWDVDPNTSAAWTYTAVNAMEVGQEVRDS